jgi:hypothetical protein
MRLCRLYRPCGCRSEEKNLPEREFGLLITELFCKPLLSYTIAPKYIREKL